MNFINNISAAWQVLSGGVSSLFTSIFMVGQGGPLWIDTSRPKLIYRTNPQLKTVIDRDAAMFSNMVLKIVDKNGQEIEDKDFQKLIQNPNALQSMNEWLLNYKQQLNVYGNQFMYKNKPSNQNTYPISLMNISPTYLQVIATGKMFDQVDLKGIIKEYEYVNLGGHQKRIFKVEEIMFTRLPDLDNPLIGCSNLEGLKYPLSNIGEAYKYLNVVDSKLGGVGIITNKSRDVTGSILLKPEEKKAIQESLLAGYGINAGQQHVHVADGDMDFKSMTVPVGEMKLLEQIDHYFLTIIDAFKHNANIYSNKNATYENVKYGIIQTYQDAIIPAADLFTQALTKFLELKEGFRIIASYDHIEILKENKLKGMQALQTVVTTLTQAVQAGFVSGEQAENILANELGLVVDPKGGNKILNALNRLSPLVANNVLQNLSRDEARGLVGAGAWPEGAIPSNAQAAPNISTQI